MKPEREFREPTFDLKKDLHIDTSDLDGEFLRQPELSHHYGELVIEAQHQHDEAKVDYDTRLAELQEEKRNDYQLSGQKLTQKLIEHLALMDPRIKTLGEDLRAKKKTLSHAKNAAKSIDSRMSSLISVGANERQRNASGNPSIKEESYASRYERPVRVKNSFHDMPKSPTMPTPAFGKNRQ